MEIDDQEIKLEYLIAALKRRSNLLVAITLAIFIVGVAVAFLLPSIYRSEAIILIEKQEIPTDLVRSTVTSFADQRIQVISQRVMSSSNLMRIIDSFALYTDERLREAREETLERMRSNISLDMISAEVVDPRSGRPTEATIAFSLAFENENAQKSQQVVNELVTLFLNENIRSRTDSAADTTAFLDDEAETLRNRVGELESKIAEFKDANPHSRPELEGLTANLMNRTELHLGEIDRRIHETVQQKIYLEAQLAQIEPNLPDAGPRGTTALEQLRAVEANLSSAEAAYGEAHPDVVRLRKQAEALRSTVDPNAARVLYEGQILTARARLNDLLEQYDGSHPDVETATRMVGNLQRKLDALPPATKEIPNNPAYVALAARLAAAIAQHESLESTRTQLAAKLEEYGENLMLIPDAEAKFRALNRDYETNLAKYREISAKQMEARLSQNLESERKGEKFTLIEPPSLPERPAKPNRPVIVILSLVLGLIAGIVTLSLVESLDDKIRGRSALQEIFGAPPLAYIPVIEVGQGVGALRRYAFLLSGVAFILILAMLAVHLAIMPLDVLWYTLLRKAGL